LSARERQPALLAGTGPLGASKAIPRAGEVGKDAPDSRKKSADGGGPRRRESVKEPRPLRP